MERLTIRENIETAIQYGLKRQAYNIYYLVLNGVEMDAVQREGMFKWVNHEEVERLMKENPLGIDPIKLFSAKTDWGFHLCLAYNVEQAAEEIGSNTSDFIPRVLEVPDGLFQKIYMIKEKEELFIFEIMDRCLEFPYYIGLMEK